MNPLKAAIAQVRKSTPSAYYAGATVGRTTEDWWAGILSADRALRSDLRLLRARSRQLCGDNPICAGVLQSFRDNVIGWQVGGIGVQALNRTGGQLNKALNRTLEDAFRTWAEDPEECSANAQYTKGDIERLFVTGLIQDGEFLCQKLVGADNASGFALKVLDPDLLDETYNLTRGPNQNEVRMGVEVDDNGRPVFYHLWNRHPADINAGGRKRLRVPADQIYHRFFSFRPGQTRGIPLFTPALLMMRTLDGYTEAHLFQARAAAATGGGFFVATGDDAAAMMATERSPTAAPNGASQPQRLVWNVEPALYRQLPPGVRFEAIDPTAPNTNFPDFQTACLRTIGRCTGLTHVTFSGDGRELTYGTLRGLSIMERDMFRGVMRFVGLTTSRMYKDWLRAASLFGEVSLPSEDASQYRAHRLQFRGYEWIDPANDALAREAKLRRGALTHTQMCEELGTDFEDNIDQLAEEYAYAKSKGVDISGIEWSGRIVDQLTAPGLAESTPAPAPPPPNGNGNGKNRVAGLLTGDHSR